MTDIQPCIGCRGAALEPQCTLCHGTGVTIYREYQDDLNWPLGYKLTLCAGGLLIVVLYVIAAVTA